MPALHKAQIMISTLFHHLNFHAHPFPSKAEIKDDQDIYLHPGKAVPKVALGQQPHTSHLLKMTTPKKSGLPKEVSWPDTEGLPSPGTQGYPKSSKPGLSNGILKALNLLPILSQQNYS